MKTSTVAPTLQDGIMSDSLMSCISFYRIEGMQDEPVSNLCVSLFLFIDAFRLVHACVYTY
jgi:hypothetical protein